MIFSMVETGKKAGFHLAAAALLGLFFMLPSPLFGQTITTEDVETVMEDPSVQEAFEGCVAGKPHPAAVDFILIINEKGKVALAFTEPEVEADVFACFQDVAKILYFKETGQKIEITYPMEFPAYVAPKPGHETDPQPQPMPEGFYAKESKKATTYKWAGGVLMALGIGAMAAGVVLYLILKEDYDDWAKAIIVVGVAGGAAVTYAGLHLFVTGRNKQRKLDKQRGAAYGYLIPRVAVAPTLRFSGAMSVLTWSF